MGVNLNRSNVYAVLDWANEMKLHVFAAKHKTNACMLCTFNSLWWLVPRFNYTWLPLKSKNWNQELPEHPRIREISYDTVEVENDLNCFHQQRRSYNSIQFKQERSKNCNNLHALYLWQTFWKIDSRSLVQLAPKGWKQCLVLQLYQKLTSFFWPFSKRKKDTKSYFHWRDTRCGKQTRRLIFNENRQT